MYAICTLTRAQQNYAQLHREALAIVFAVKKIHKYIFGKPFTIYSDHQPLQEIFNERKSMPIAAGRLQRWAIFLALYDYHIEYRRGSRLGNADALSRLPLPIENDIESGNIHTFSEKSPVNLKQVAEQTQTDGLLSVVYQHLLQGWKSPVSLKAKPYHQKRLMLSSKSM